MLVIFDGDGTLWSGDVLAGYLSSPLRQVDEDTVEDHEGKRVKLHEGVRDVLEELRSRRIFVALASENREVPVIALLQRLQLAQYFNFLEISWVEKDKMITRILRTFEKKGKNPGTIFFVDDFDYNIEIVQDSPALSHIHCINVSELKSIRDVLYIVGAQTE